MTGSIVLSGVPGLRVTPALLAEGADRLQRAMHVRAGLDVNRDDVSAGLGEGGEERIGRRDHQMDVEGFLGVRAQRLHHIRPDRDVGHEVAVHHVNMDPVGAGGVDRAHLLAELREVGGENGRCDKKRAHGMSCYPIEVTRAREAGNVALATGG